MSRSAGAPDDEVPATPTPSPWETYSTLRRAMVVGMFAAVGLVLLLVLIAFVIVLTHAGGVHMQP
jgi:hypothetical protein